MNVAVRVDASAGIGTGHVMRCLTLADALVTHGARVTFVSRDLPDSLASVVREHGHTHLGLPPAPDATPDIAPPAHAAWLRAGWADDARQTCAALAGHNMDWLVVDHYAIDARWESAVRSTAARVLVIDDLADRPHSCDVILDQNLFPDADTRYDGLVPDGCVRWIGPSHVLLREGLARLSTTARVRTGPVRRVLVAFAGADTANHTMVAIAALAEAEMSALRVDVLVSAHHPAIPAVRDACETAGFHLHVQVPDVAPLMASADIAIAACGFMCYELAAMRLPSILVPVSPIQATVAGILASRGVAVVVAPDESGVMRAGLQSAWRALCEDEVTRTAMSRAGAAITDGQGAARVAGQMRAFLG